MARVSSLARRSGTSRKPVQIIGQVLVMTLQLFPNVEGDLAQRIPGQITVVADEAHRPHANNGCVPYDGGKW